jgi:hypothetical protein
VSKAEREMAATMGMMTEKHEIPKPMKEMKDLRKSSREGVCENGTKRRCFKGKGPPKVFVAVRVCKANGDDGKERAVPKPSQTQQHRVERLATRRATVMVCVPIRRSHHRQQHKEHTLGGQTHTKARG